MSHHQILMAFREGEPVPFSLKSLFDILASHRCIARQQSEGGYFVEFPLKGPHGTIGSEGEIFLTDKDATDFSIERPYYDDEFFALTFDLISTLDLCMFISSGEWAVVSKSELVAHLPPVLAEVVRVVLTREELRDNC